MLDLAHTKRIAQAIVNVFETGTPAGDYSACTILDDGAGISYGRSQSTDGGGALDEIALRYVDARGRCSERLRPFLPRLAANETRALTPSPSPSTDPDLPSWARELCAALVDAGADPVMRTVQDQVFDERYWAPAASQCAAMYLSLPLSWAVVYDTAIQSGPGGIARMRLLFPEVPPARGGDERAWTRAYIAARRKWLTSRGGIVAKTVYRSATFEVLVAANNWELGTPLRVLGREIR